MRSSSKRSSQGAGQARKGRETAEPTRATEFHFQNGVPVFLVDRRPVPPLAADLLPDTTASQIAACASASIHLYRVRSCDLGWMGVGKFDYAVLEARLDTLLAADPDARFWLELSVDAPAWWCAANPAECVAYCLPAPPDSAEQHRARPPAFASWASLRWQNEAGNALARLIQHLRGSTWERAWLGVQLAAGTDGEWRMPQAERLPDTGPRMTEQFRAFAREKYRRNAGLLRRAWDDPRADFERITCPDAGDRRRADRGAFRDPARSRRTLDYYECLSQAQNTAALHFCAVARRASDGHALVGLSYATVCDEETLPEDGHLFPETALDSPDVDFFANAGPADGSAFLRALPGSLTLRGKFLFHSPRGPQPPLLATALAQTHDAGVILPARTPAADLRAAFHALEGAQRAPAQARRRSGQVAVVVDPAAPIYIAESDAGWLGTALHDQMRELTRLGAPFDVYLPADLAHPQFADHKVTLFLNTFYLSDAERRRLDARIKRSGQTAVWLWAPGIIGEEGITAEAGQRLCGQKLRLENNATSLRVRIVASDDPLTWGFHVGATFGLDHAAAPTLTITDKTSVRLGANTANKTVFGARRTEAWTSVVCGTPLVPAGLLRNILRAAGCHLYTEAAEAVVLANAASVAVFTPRGGTLTLSLPGVYTVTDALTAAPVAQAASEFTVTLPPNTTGFYTLQRK